MAGSLAPRTTLCSALWSEAGRLPYHAADATSQDVLDGAAFEDLRTHAKSFQSPEGD